MEACHLLNIVISILKLKALAVILERWNTMDAKKHTPEGKGRHRQPASSSSSSKPGTARSGGAWASCRVAAASPLVPRPALSQGTRPLT